MGQNKLAAESSLYLRQHADNPVEWWPWCEEAFEHAEKEGKPVLVSIGYSSCHWCHVMAHECFEDSYIASLMNRLFVNIKVDREERPDVDQIYMEAVQMLNQQGGWPLNVFCLPDKRPFTGGTYFPPEDRGHGIIPWPHLLLRISDAFQHEREGLVSNANAIQQNLKFLSESVLEHVDEWNDQVLFDGAKAIVDTLDEKYGGFGDAPKFPPSQILGYLMAVRTALGVSEEDQGLSTAIDNSLRICSHALIRGGLYDHVGGGFFRYSVDREWRVPHFEKMLYDNALLLENLSKVWSRSRWSGLESAVRKTVNWLFEEFQVGPGVFAAAMDADTDEGEGAYYLWSEVELREAISSTEVDGFLGDFSIRGKDGLNLYPWAVDDQSYRGYAMIFHDLKELRAQRPAPAIDRKVLLAWNGLLLRGLVVGSTIFGERRWLEIAREGLDWLWSEMRNSDGSLASVFYTESKEKTGGEGFLDDFVNFALANVQFATVADTLEVGLHATYKGRAVELLRVIMEKFSDKNENTEGFFFCSDADSKSHIVRKKEWFDNAYPCGNSGIVQLLSLLGSMGCDLDCDQDLGKLRQAYMERSRRMPNGIASGMEALTWESVGVISIKVAKDVDLRHLQGRIREKPWRPHWIQVDQELDAGQILVCIGKRCLVPTQSLDDVLSHF